MSVYTPDLDYTGTYDMSDRWMEVFRTVPSRGVIEFPTKDDQIIRAEKGLRVNRAVTIHGQGATTFFRSQGTRIRSNVDILSGGVAIYDLFAQGANPHAGTGDTAYNPALEAQHGFNIIGSIGGVYLIGCGAHDTYGDFLYIGQAGKPTVPHTIYVKNFTGVRSGRQGVAITGARNAWLENLNLFEIRRSTIDFEPGTSRGSVTNVTILNPRVVNGRLNFVSAHGLGDVSNITIQGAEVHGQDLSITVKPETGKRRRNWRVIDCKGLGPSGNPFLATMGFENVDGVEVRGCYQNMQLRGGPGGPGPRMYLVRQKNCSNINIAESGNTVKNGAGILKPTW